MGALVAFVIWVVAIALIWAFMQGQATSGALTGVVRVTALTGLTLAGESALEEASIALRRPKEVTSPVLEAIRNGSDAGEAHDPKVTRDLFGADVAAGRLELGAVKYRVVHRGTDKHRDPWLIELTVKSTFRAGAATMTRTVVRRYTGRLCHIRVAEGRHESAPIYTSFSMDRRPVLQVVES